MAGVQSRNEVEFDVKLKLTEALYFTCGAYVSRFPYVLAILLMLETGEMFKTSLSVDQSRLTMAYAHLGGYFLAATAMSFNLFQAKRTFALFTAMQFGVLSVECYLETERKEGLLVSTINFDSNTTISKIEDGCIPVYILCSAPEEPFRTILTASIRTHAVTL